MTGLVPHGRRDGRPGTGRGSPPRRPRRQDAHDRQEDDRAHRCDHQGAQPPGAGIRAGHHDVGRGRHEEAGAGEVHGPPPPHRQAPAQQRCDLDGDEEVRGHHTPGNGRRPPLGHERDQHVRNREPHPVVEQQGGDVHAGERDSQAAEGAMQVRQPCRTRPAPGHPGRQRQAPHDGGGGQGPGNHTCTARHVPGQLRAH